MSYHMNIENLFTDHDTRDEQYWILASTQYADDVVVVVVVYMIKLMKSLQWHSLFLLLM